MEKILVVDRVTKEYPGRFAVCDLSFEVKKGSIHGFLGPNGAGKSTTLKMIAGLMTATSGVMTLMGEEIFPGRLSLKNYIGFLPENVPLYLDMTVEKYLLLVARLHLVTHPADQVAKVLEELSLVEVRKRLIGNLSKGYRQRVGLAGAIVYDAPFLILDEPTSGLDPQSVVELREYIKKLSSKKTILFSSHVLSEVEQLCDELTIINQGRIRASGDLSEIHHKFHQGLVLRIGIKPDQSLPDLSSFGKYEVSQVHHQTYETQYHLVFEEDRDFRPDLGRFLISSGVDLLTLSIDTPELEDIFLRLTELEK